mgnify:CR=1 FL=1
MTNEQFKIILEEIHKIKAELKTIKLYLKVKHQAEKWEKEEKAT